LKSTALCLFTSSFSAGIIALNLTSSAASILAREIRRRFSRKCDRSSSPRLVLREATDECCESWRDFVKNLKKFADFFDTIAINNPINKKCNQRNGPWTSITKPQRSTGVQRYLWQFKLTRQMFVTRHCMLYPLTHTYSTTLLRSFLAKKHYKLTYNSLKFTKNCKSLNVRFDHCLKQKKNRTSTWLNSGDYLQFSAKNGVFFKNNVMFKFWHKFSAFWVKNDIWTIFKIITLASG
jgi:hypothetical protein